MPSVSRRELIRKFRKLGFTGPVPGGKHQFMAKESLKIRVPSPHGGSGIDINAVLRTYMDAERT
jgi:predicted RNA binding protein YcfA (HicA-like mRNA interferase family)